MLDIIDRKIALQKSVADKVLEKLELLDYRCIVAGGAARDWYLGKPAKDIDVFLYAPRLNSQAIREESLKRLGFNITSAYENWRTNEIYKHNKYVKCLYNTLIDEESVQIIFMTESTYTSVVDKFPISISKAWYKNKQIKFDKDFENSVKHKILWKTVDNYSEDDKYITRIKNKFNDYKYVSVEEATKIIKEGNKDELIKELRQQLNECERQYKRRVYLLESEIKELRNTLH